MKVVQFVPCDAVLKKLSSKAVLTLSVLQTDQKEYFPPQVTTNFSFSLLR